MKIVSTAFAEGGAIPARYTCEGENVSPPLQFLEVPSAALSLALIVDDPDAPVGTWVHWVVWGIAPADADVKEATVPQGAKEGVTSFGRPGYGGPCPPTGTHRYFFKLYALDTVLTLSPEADKMALEEAMLGHILERAELVGLYAKKR